MKFCAHAFTAIVASLPAAAAAYDAVICQSSGIFQEAIFHEYKDGACDYSLYSFASGQLSESNETTYGYNSCRALALNWARVQSGTCSPPFFTPTIEGRSEEFISIKSMFDHTGDEFAEITFLYTVPVFGALTPSHDLIVSDDPLVYMLVYEHHGWAKVALVTPGSQSLVENGPRDEPINGSWAYGIEYACPQEKIQEINESGQVFVGSLFRMAPSDRPGIATSYSADCVVSAHGFSISATFQIIADLDNGSFRLEKPEAEQTVEAELTEPEPIEGHWVACNDAGFIDEQIARFKAQGASVDDDEIAFDCGVEEIAGLKQSSHPDIKRIIFLVTNITTMWNGEESAEYAYNLCETFLEDYPGEIQTAINELSAEHKLSADEVKSFYDSVAFCMQ